VDGNHFSKILMKNGLITKATHDRTVRFAPALVIKEDEINQACEVISKSLRELEKKNEQMS
jgi:ornithine--oxo-acid transaminase